MVLSSISPWVGPGWQRDWTPGRANGQGEAFLGLRL